MSRLCEHADRTKPRPGTTCVNTAGFIIIYRTMMATNTSGNCDDLATLEVSSFVRGYHAYQTIWNPRIGEVLRLQRQPDNCTDKFAVAVIQGGTVVGHLPYNLAPTISHFLRRSVNTGEAKVTGTRVNRGAGYGLEIPCTYKFYGPRRFIDKLKTLIS